jgi:hypothetical protein
LVAGPSAADVVCKVAGVGDAELVSPDGVSCLWRRRAKARGA